MRKARATSDVALMLLLATTCHQYSCVSVDGAPITVLDSLNGVWSNVALRAAEETVKAVKKQTNLDLSLRDVDMESLQVYLGHQHHIGLEVEGVNYEVMLGGEAEWRAQAAKALPEKAGDKPGSGLVNAKWWQLREQVPALPDVTLAGPIELLLPSSTSLGLYLPHAVDAGPARRVLLAENTVVTIKGLKSIQLRRPLDMPALPAQYLAEVYAHLALQEPEPGFPSAPGIMYLASELRKAASANSSRAMPPALSFEVTVADAGLTIVAASEFPGSPPPRLRAKKLKDGALELSVRESQVQASNGRLNLAELTHTWAWPLPAVDMSSWVSYETLLRGILGGHPMDLPKVSQRGVALRLTKSTMQGVRLLKFDMEVRGQAAAEPEEVVSKVIQEMLMGSEPETDVGPLEIWEVVVQLKEVKEDGSLSFVPLQAKRKAVYGPTLTMSRSALLMALNGNTSVPLGYEEHDLGFARNAP